MSLGAILSLVAAIVTFYPCHAIHATLPPPPTIRHLPAMDELAAMSPSAVKLYNIRIRNDEAERIGAKRETEHALQKQTRRAVNEWNSAFINLFFTRSRRIDRYDATHNLHRAAIYGSTEGVKTMLLVAGANPLLMDPLQRTASHLAAARGNMDVVKVTNEVVKDIDRVAGTTTDVNKIGDGLGNTPKGLRGTTIPRPEPVKFDDIALAHGGYNDGGSLPSSEEEEEEPP